MIVAEKFREKVKEGVSGTVKITSFTFCLVV